MSERSLPRARAALSRLLTPAALRAIAVIVAAGLAYNGARILNDSPRTADQTLANFDAAAPWLGLALIALVAATWQPLRWPEPAGLRRWFAKVWDEHYLEALLFLVIIGAGTFMRFFHFGGTLPPEIGLCCEEHINGGVAYDALDGDRPLLFPLVRWTSAAGFLAFGETTLGLRFFFPVMGVATLVIFYFLLRQLASVQAALVGLALYAIAWWPALRTRQTSGGTLYAVLFAFLAVRAMRTRNPLLFLATGAVAGLISYEYEAFRAVPIIAAGFFGLAAAWHALQGGPLKQARRRVTEMARAAWQPALFFLMAAGIVLVPMIVGTNQGKDLYLTSVHRNEDTRGGSRLADEWPDQLRWAATMFLPFGPADYPTSPPRDVAETQLLDPFAASLALLGVVAAIVFFRRGYRTWFLMWIGLSLLGGALLLGEFAPWSFFGLVPILLALVALFIDDLRGFLSRVRGAAGTRALTGLLVAGVAFSLWWNADTLFNDVENSREIQRVYGGEISFVYALCDYLRGRGDDNYTYAYSNAVTVDGFAALRDSPEEERRAWSDFIWACHDLEGTALPAPQEAWPLRGLPSGPTTLAFADPIVAPEELIAELNRVYPGLGAPDHQVTGPADTYDLLAYEFASGSDLDLRGLWGEYRAGDGTGLRAAIDPVNDLTFDPSLAAPFDVRWTGVIRVREETAAALEVVGPDGADVLLDGVPTQTATGSLQPSALLPGWHAIEISLRVDDPAESVRLQWVDGLGANPVVEEDLFPLTELAGWRHTRSLGLAGDRQQAVSQRLDFSPHLALATVLRLASPTAELFVTEERWEGVVTVEGEERLTLEAEFRAGAVRVLIDSSEVASAEASSQPTTVLQTSVSLTPGDHRIELVQELDRDTTWSGATLTLTNGSGRSPAVRPY